MAIEYEQAEKVYEPSEIADRYLKVLKEYGQGAAIFRSHVEIHMDVFGITAKTVEAEINRLVGIIEMDENEKGELINALKKEFKDILSVKD